MTTTTATDWRWPICFACNIFGGCERHPSRQWLRTFLTVDAPGWTPQRASAASGE